MAAAVLRELCVDAARPARVRKRRHAAHEGTALLLLLSARTCGLLLLFVLTFERRSFFARTFGEQPRRAAKRTQAHATNRDACIHVIRAFS